MNYGYIRVSTDKQKTENQIFEIEKFCRQNEIKIDKWIKEKISGKTGIEKRNLGKLLRKITKNDVIICSELSRLSREMYDLISVWKECKEQKANIITIKENLNPQQNKYIKYLVPIFAIAVEFERDFISQRTKEALAYRKTLGIQLGRPIGSKSKHRKLSGKENLILNMKKEGISLRKMAKILKVSINTLSVFIKENGL